MMKRITFSVTDNAFKLTKEEAERLGISVADFLRMLMTQYFDGIKFEREKQSIPYQPNPIHASPFQARPGQTTPTQTTPLCGDTSNLMEGEK